MALGILDLTLVTSGLVDLLTASVTNTALFDDEHPAFTITVSGKPPDLLRREGECQLGVYLFHVTQDRSQRTSPVIGRNDPTVNPRVPPLPAQPLSLDLYYLLTAFSASATHPHLEEQQAMSIALKCLHEHPIVTLPAASGEGGELCLTMEMLSADEMGRFWQATTQSLRLGVVYKVSVVFMRPPDPAPPAKKPKTFTLAVDAAAAPFTQAVQVFGTHTTVRYRRPKSPPDFAEYGLFPATVAPGQPFVLHGSGFQPTPPNADRVYLVAPDGTEEDVTATWVNTAVSTRSRYLLTIPAVPGRTSGFYQLRIGNAVAAGSAGAVRSNATPFGLAASVDAGNSAFLPVPGVGQPWQLGGTGFVDGATEVCLETISLRAATGGTTGPGEFRVASATSLEFRLPAGLASGLYAVRVRVNQVESPPAKWVQVP
jgi:hypothetical protein